MEDFNLLSLLKQAAPFVWFTLILLLLCSLWTWYLFVWKWVETRRAMIHCQKFARFYHDSTKKSQIYLQLQPRYNQLRGFDQLLVFLTRNFQALIKTYPNQIEFVFNSLDKRAGQFVQERIRSMSRGCATLATIATTAPFIGLMGTVWGVIDVFSGLGQANQVNLKTIAPGIAETLVATALGLVTAIPASVFYNWLVLRMQELNAQYEAFANHIIQDFDLSGKEPSPDSHNLNGSA